MDMGNARIDARTGVAKSLGLRNVHYDTDGTIIGADSPTGAPMGSRKPQGPADGSSLGNPITPGLDRNINDAPRYGTDQEKQLLQDRKDLFSDMQTADNPDSPELRKRGLKLGILPPAWRRTVDGMPNAPAQQASTPVPTAPTGPPPVQPGLQSFGGDTVANNIKKFGLKAAIADFKSRDAADTTARAARNAGAAVTMAPAAQANTGTPGDPIDAAYAAANNNGQMNAVFPGMGKPAPAPMPAPTTATPTAKAGGLEGTITDLAAAQASTRSMIGKPAAAVAPPPAAGQASAIPVPPVPASPPTADATNSPQNAGLPSWKKLKTLSPSSIMTPTTSGRGNLAMAGSPRRGSPWL